MKEVYKEWENKMNYTDLEKLNELKTKGIITEDEFQKMKNDLLNNNSNKQNDNNKKAKKGFASKHPIITVILILFIIGSVGAGISGSKTIKTSTSTNTNTKSQNNQYMTIDEFNQIKTGMTYEEVVNIVGGYGELVSEVNIGEPAYHTRIYTWYGANYYLTGANANVTFQGGKVIAKAQMGL